MLQSSRHLLICFLFLMGLSSCGLFRKTLQTHEVAASKNRKQVLAEAKKYLGTGYCLGGNDKKCLDCSGLVKNAFDAVGCTISRTCIKQFEEGQVISKEKAKPGDLIFFDTSKNNKQKVNHVGIVIQNSKENGIHFIHASTSKGVMENSLQEPYFQKTFICIKTYPCLD